ncbi:hypothetical protein [Planctomicrobium sp. SH664]|uniref:hypothetical protein n=1 Tax=Planctomicrobium sp. SH664 TaxID=3448125 RepID=UPI003F5B25F2
MIAPSRLALSMFATVCALLNVVPLCAQDMRVYTRVTDLSRGPEQSRILSNSLTLFHAGKVYDYMDEVGEVVIFEPMHHRFIVISRDLTATEVSFSELNQFLETAQIESQKYIEELAARQDAAATKIAASIRFQLQPEFHEAFDAAQNRLSLNGGALNYGVKTANVNRPDCVANYLHYADWAARLNYVLHPHSTYPAARIKLNTAMRDRALLPVQVDLSLHLNEPIRLRADHTFAWEFQSADRRHINHWEQKLQSKEVRWVSFHEYQQRLLAHVR